ncbi:hypothetical protein, partial [Pelomonas sp. BJYL3]|uniref:hypothetical protein n=1 Tax=Pelomonas sp. BJYL3 TaxID=2976697 RepID=UPI0022B3CE57
WGRWATSRLPSSKPITIVNALVRPRTSDLNQLASAEAGAIQPASACLRKPMICSSVNLLFFMSVILLVDGLHYLYAGTAGRGQVKIG